MPKISMDKQYKTRDGRPVRIICVDREDDDYPIVALINWENGKDRISTYTTNGKGIKESCSVYDLIEVPVEHEVHVLKYNDGSYCIQLTKSFKGDELKNWLSCPFYMGTTKIVLPTKE